MLKVTIQEKDGAKIFFVDGVQFVDRKNQCLVYNELTLFSKGGKEKSGTFLLHKGDTVLIEEADND